MVASRIRRVLPARVPPKMMLFSSSTHRHSGPHGGHRASGHKARRPCAGGQRTDSIASFGSGSGMVPQHHVRQFRGPGRRGLSSRVRPSARRASSIPRRSRTGCRRRRRRLVDERIREPPRIDFRRSGRGRPGEAGRGERAAIAQARSESRRWRTAAPRRASRSKYTRRGSLRCCRTRRRFESGVLAAMAEGDDPRERRGEACPCETSPTIAASHCASNLLMRERPSRMAAARPQPPGWLPLPPAGRVRRQ